MKEHIQKKIKQSTIEINKSKYNSYFDESVKAYLILQLKFIAICVCTLGFGYPWAMCMKYRAKYHHSVICGKRLKFIGQPMDLAHHWIWWWILCIITLGIFALFLHVRMEKWTVANVIFEDVKEID